MVVCSDDDTARRVRLLRNQGMERRYANEIVGHNARMTDVHAAIGRVQLRRLPSWTAERRRNAQFLTGALAPVADSANLSLPAVAALAEPVWHQYTVRYPQRDRLIELLSHHNVPSGVYYPTPIHRLPAYDLDLDLPNTVAAADEVLSLPVHPALSTAHLELVADAVHRAVDQ